jgi:hypothetical protein
MMTLYSEESILRWDSFLSDGTASFGLQVLAVLTLNISTAMTAVALSHHTVVALCQAASKIIGLRAECGVRSLVGVPVREPFE